MEKNEFYVVASLVMSLLMHGAQGDFCETTWFFYEDVCFKYFNENIVQAETKEQCESRGARLITALTPRLKDFLVQRMDENENSSYWCHTQSGEIDSSLLMSTSTVSPHSRITSPTTVSSTLKKGKLCYYLQDKALHAGDCDAPRGFICEKDSITPPANCPQSTDKIGMNCFWRTSELLTKTKAEETCSRQGGSLANLETRRKRTYAIATVALRKTNLWVNAVKHEGKIKWENGDILDPEQEKTFIPFKDDGGDCVILGRSNVSESGTSWIFGNCTRTAYGLCEKEAVLTPIPVNTTTEIPQTTKAPTCPGSSANDREKDGICHWETTYEAPRFNWDTAREYCQSYGGDLASYSNAEEEELSLGIAKGHPRGLWIGLRRDPGSNVFKWSDGSTLTYTNWAPGQPKTTGNLKLCVAHTGKNSSWEVTYCGVYRWFVCKIPKATIPSSPVLPTAAPAPECRRYSSSSLLTWTYSQGYCYAFYQAREFSYETAKSFCQDNGAFLVSLHSFNDIDSLLEMSPVYDHKRNFWLGLRAKGLHSSYRWDDGTPFDFVNWDEDNPYDDSSNTDTCVTFDESTGFWKKEHCNQLEYLICKAPNGTNYRFSTPAPTASLPGYCPDGWYSFGNKCYRVFGERKRITWSEANTKCAQMGSQLTSVHSKEENDFLILLMLATQSSMWLGMYSTIGGRLFHWTDNSTIDYTNWDSNEPNYSDEKEECVQIVFSTNEGKLGKWNDQSCSRNYPVICQIPKDPMLTKPGLDPFLCAEPDGWMKLGSSCYQIFNESDNRLTWLQAQSFCLSHRANLASIRNYGISAHLRSRLKGSTGILWIGVSDTKENNYQWIGPSKRLIYTNWLRDQPKSVSSLHNCVAVNSDGKWMVRNCEESHPFICEESKEAPTVEPHDPDMVCPSKTKWKDFGGKYCYIIETVNQKTWYMAAHHCFKEDGYLTSFHSERELEVILHHLKDYGRPVFIGLARREDGSFGWLDRSAVDYVNWAPGEPNDYNEMCVEMHTDIGTWNDIKCNTQGAYVCSTKKVPRNVSTADALTDKGRDLEAKINAGGIAGITICIIVVLIVAGVAIYYYCPSTAMRVRRLSESSQI